MGEKRQNISEAEAYALFRTGMADLAAPIPPEQPVVSLDQAKKITEYLVRTFFGHFTLYQAVYQCDAEEVKLEKKMQLETSVMPLPTSKAKTLEQVEQEVNTNTLTADCECVVPGRGTEAG